LGSRLQSMANPRPFDPGGSRGVLGGAAAAGGLCGCNARAVTEEHGMPRWREQQLISLAAALARSLESALSSRGGGLVGAPSPWCLPVPVRRAGPNGAPRKHPLDPAACRAEQSSRRSAAARRLRRVVLPGPWLPPLGRRRQPASARPRSRCHPMQLVQTDCCPPLPPLRAMWQPTKARSRSSCRPSDAPAPRKRPRAPRAYPARRPPSTTCGALRSVVADPASRSPTVSVCCKTRARPARC